MLKIKTYLEKSTVHGIGLFTSEDIKKNQVIGELGKFDLLIHKDDIDESEYGFFKMYSSAIGEYRQTYFDNMRFMNHSADNNCIDTPDGKTIAIRDISIGEELTCNYSLICDEWK